MINKFRIYIVLIIILKSGAVFFQKYDNISTYVLFSLILFYFIIFNKKYLVNKKYFLFTILIVLASIFPMLIANEYSYYLQYVKLALLFLFLSLIPQIVNYDQFRDIYIKLVIFLGITSLIIHFVIQAKPSIASLFPIIESYGGSVRYNNLLFYLSLITDYPNNRNYSIFYEPGVYQAFLNIAIIFELQKNYLKNLPILFLFVISIITTFSTTGLICLFLVFLILFLNNYKLWRKKRIYIYLFLFPLIFFGLYSGLLYKEIIEKLSESSYSFFSRSIGSLLDIQIFLENPFFGAGYEKYKKMIKYLAFQNYQIDVGGSTNSFTNSLSKFGIIFTSLSLFMHYTVGLSFTKNIFKRGIYFLILTIVLMTENFFLSPFFIVLSYYGLWYFCRNKTIPSNIYFFK